MAHDWQLIGFVLALEVIYATGVAFWTRWSSNAKLQGQTIWHVVVGVAGVVLISGIRGGFEAAGWVIVCFAAASVPMAIEYFGRLKKEEADAQRVFKESCDVDAGTDREA